MTEYAQASSFQVEPALAGRLAAAKEAVWLRIGVLQSAMNDRERALEAFERVLAVNPANVRAMTQAGAVLAKKECYPQAVEYLLRAIRSDSSCGEAWAVLAHCYVMTDELPKAYQAYQSALSHLPNPRDPNLWYGIGLLYDRYGSLDNALEAFLAVLSISPDFERADEVCFCIGIIFKEQQNFDEALKYFNKVVVAANPPPPLTRADGWYQIGHVNELKRDIPMALDMYKHALSENPKHPKTLQNYGWLEHQHNSNSAEAIRLLKLSADLDPGDGQTWYLLGRVYMALREFRQAYDAYQQAVYRDGRNATFWCSIGVLYYQMNQYRDAMDAYSRAIRLNPYVSEVWYDLGTLYESCGQNADAVDAYRRAAELAPDNTQITARLGVLESSMNLSAHPQGGQAIQPQHAVQQGQPQQLPPQQMQPDMHHPGQQQMQSQLNPVLNRTITGPLQHLPQPLGGQKLSHHPSALPPSQLQPPAHQLSHPTSLSQPLNSTAMSVSQRSAQIELAAIPSLRPQGLPQSQSMGQSGAFSQDGRPSLPGPLSSVQMNPQHSSTTNQLSPMMSQGLHTQQQTNMLPPSGMNSSQPMQDFRQRSGSLPHSQLQPLNHHDPQAQRHSQIPHLDSQHSHHHQGPLPLVTMPQQQQQQQQGRHVPQQGQTQLELQHGNQMQSQSLNHHTSSRLQTQESPQPQPAQHSQSQQPHQQGLPHHLSPQRQSQAPHGPLHQHQHHSSRSQGQGHHQIPHQQSNALPQIQALPQLPALSHTPQQQDSDHRRGKGALHQSMLGSNEPHRHGDAHDQGSDRAQYMVQTADQLRRQDLSRADAEQDSRLAAIPKSEPHGVSGPFPSSGVEPPRASQPMFSSHSNTIHSTASPRREMAPLREPGSDPITSSGPPSRTMAMREITESETPSQSRVDETNRNEMDRLGRERSELDSQDQHLGGKKGHLPDRLPAVSSLSEPMQSHQAMRDSREDANLLTSVATSGMSIPASSGASAMGSGDGLKPHSANQSVHGAAPRSSPSDGNALLLPPMSSRNSSVTGVGQDSKDHATGMGVGVSSLTQFGKARTPATPVNNSVAASPLPSPLPARKVVTNGGIVHARSPRLSKPASGSTFKSVSIPPASSAGQMESVPSPSSLPVLPALSSHPTDDGVKSSPPSKGADHEENRSDRDGLEDSRVAGSEGEEKSGTEALDGHARKIDDGIMNKPLFGMLRSAPAPVHDMGADKNEEAKSPANSGTRHDVESSGTMKRDSSSNDDHERVAKRPRLHESGDSNVYNYDGDKKLSKRDESDLNPRVPESTRMSAPLSAKGGNPMYSEGKADARPSSSPLTLDADNASKREGSGRSSDGDGGKGIGVSGQVIDLPRLSTPTSKLSGPPSLPGNTPLPSFRSERRNLTAAKSGSGSVSGGKSTSQENTSRSSLPFALRSAPVTSLPAPVKSHALSSSRGGTDQEYGGPQTAEDSGVKRASEDKQGSPPTGGNSSRDDTNAEIMINGDMSRKVSGGSRDHEGRRESEMNAKDDKQSGRTEIHSGAT